MSKPALATNVTVAVRLRPLSPLELKLSQAPVVEVVDEHLIKFDPKLRKGSWQSSKQAGARKVGQRRKKDLLYGFDCVFGEKSTQQQVYEKTGKLVVDNVLGGYNATVFAYGSTGAGKTSTMIGNEKLGRGIMVLTVEDIFKKMTANQETHKYKLSLSYLEVYNETIRDLLVPESPALLLCADKARKMMVKGLTVHHPKDAQEVMVLLKAGTDRRSQSPTDSNKESSRSHAVLQIFVESQEKCAGIAPPVLSGKLSLIDLAGSERAASSTNQGQIQREGANINRSLLALGNCINALCKRTGKNCYVPFRDSKLTRLLQDSLGGNCRTVMIANISPAMRSYEDTHNTLKYANHAKNIKTNISKNQHTVASSIHQYKQHVRELEAKVKTLTDQLSTTASQNVGLSDGERKLLEASRTELAEKLTTYESEQQWLWKSLAHAANLSSQESHYREQIEFWEEKKRKHNLTSSPMVTKGLRARFTETQYLLTQLERDIGKCRARIKAQKKELDDFVLKKRDELKEGGHQQELDREISENISRIRRHSTVVSKIQENNARDIERMKQSLTTAYQSMSTLMDVIRAQHQQLQSGGPLDANLQNAFDKAVEISKRHKIIDIGSTKVPIGIDGVQDADSAKRILFTPRKETSSISSIRSPFPTPRNFSPAGSLQKQILSLNLNTPISTQIPTSISTPIPTLITTPVKASSRHIQSSVAVRPRSRIWSNEPPRSLSENSKPRKKLDLSPKTFRTPTRRRLLSAAFRSPTMDTSTTKRKDTDQPSVNPLSPSQSNRPIASPPSAGRVKKVEPPSVIGPPQRILSPQGINSFGSAYRVRRVPKADLPAKRLFSDVTHSSRPPAADRSKKSRPSPESPVKKRTALRPVKPSALNRRRSGLPLSVRTKTRTQTLREAMIKRTTTRAQKLREAAIKNARSVQRPEKITLPRAKPKTKNRPKSKAPPKNVLQENVQPEKQTRLSRQIKRPRRYDLSKFSRFGHKKAKHVAEKNEAPKPNKSPEKRKHLATPKKLF